MRIVKPQERWFKVEGDPDGAEVKIKHLTPGERQDITEKAFAQEVEYRKGDKGELTPVFKQTTNRRLDTEETMKAAVVDWKKFYDRDGKALPCNEKNVVRACREIEGFVGIVNSYREVLANDIAQEKRGQEKN